MPIDNPNETAQEVVKPKSTYIAFLCWLFSGLFGGHRFYLGFIKSGMLLFFITCCMGVFTVLLVGYVHTYIMLALTIEATSEAIFGDDLLAEFTDTLLADSDLHAIGFFALFIFSIFISWILVEVCRLSSLTQKANELRREKAKIAAQ